jgi:DNA modification methylase
MELNKIYCENCLETMARMPDNFVDLTVTSPPYDNLRDYKGYSFDFQPIARELYRVTKSGGVVVWVVGDATINGSETGTSFKQALYFMETGFKLHDTMIYHKFNPIPSVQNRYLQCWEYMFIFIKGLLNTFNPIIENTINNGLLKRYKSKSASKNENSAQQSLGQKAIKGYHVKETKYHDNIFSYIVGCGQTTIDEIAFNHPAIFPEQLAADHIYTWSNEGDLVYDTFGGSGTTAKMAHLQKRNWIISEISSEYCEIARKRIKPYLQQQTLEFKDLPEARE